MSTAQKNTPENLKELVHASFVRQDLMQHLGARLVRVSPDEVDIGLPYSERVTQQQGGFHGGAVGVVAKTY